MNGRCLFVWEKHSFRIREQRRALTEICIISLHVSEGIYQRVLSAGRFQHFVFDFQKTIIICKKKIFLK